MRSFEKRSAVISLLFLMGFASASALAAPGDLDPDFGQYGRAFYAIPNTSTVAARSIRQSDGKIVVAGYVQATGAMADMLAVRFNADGSVDTGFGSAGRLQVDFGGFHDMANAFAQQSDGKLVLAGSSASATFSAGTGAVTRLNPDGAIDTTFGVGGRVSLAMLGPIGGAAVLSDGKILVAGWRIADVGLGYSVVRLLATGAIDTTFGVSGVASIVLPINGYSVSGIRVQSDGRILVFGTMTASLVRNAAVVRFTADGQPDVTFNGSGYLLVPCVTTEGSCSWSDAVQQPDQRIVLVGVSGGTVFSSTPLTQYGSTLARINVDGSIDSSFGTNGFVTSVFANAYYGQPLHSSEIGRRVMLDASGNILVLGGTANHFYNSASLPTTTPWDVVVARFNSHGQIDSSFGFGGYTVVDFSLDAELGYASAADFGLLPDGSVYLVSTRTSSTFAIGLAKLSSGAAAAGIVRSNGLSSRYTETAGAAVLRVRRTGGTSGVVSVDYSTASGTAVAGADFLAVSGTLTWAHGESSEKIVLVPIIADSVAEASDESFTLNLSNPTGGVRIDGTSMSVTIARDDVSPDVAFQLSSSTISANEGQGSVAVTVTRSGTSVGAAAVTYFTVAGTAEAGQDYTSTRGVLVWDAGDVSPKTIVIPIIDDTVSESVEDFHLLLVNGGVTLAGASTTVTLYDDDPPQVSMLAAAVSVSESQPFVTLSVARTGTVTQTISVNYATASGTATAGSDFTATSNTLTWLTTDSDVKQITIPLLTDSSYEGNETFTVTLSAVTGGAVLGMSTTTVTIIDDDQAPIPSASQPTSPSSDGGGGGLFDWLWFVLLSLLLVRSSQRRRIVRC